MTKNCDLRLENAALGLRPWTAFSRPRSQFFTRRTSQPANKNIFLALRKAVTTHVKKISYFFSCVDIANQLQKRHSPLAPLSLVDWWMAKHRREFICLFILFPIQSCLFLRLARTMAEKFVLHTDTDVEKFLANRRGLDVAFGVSRDGERESKTCHRPNWIPSWADFCYPCGKSLAKSMKQQLVEDSLLRLNAIWQKTATH